MKHEITSETKYHETVVSVYNLMNKGEANLGPAELKQLAGMAKAAEKYEDEVLELVPLNKPGR